MSGIPAFPDLDDTVAFGVELEPPVSVIDSSGMDCPAELHRRLSGLLGEQTPCFLRYHGQLEPSYWLFDA